MADRLMPAMTEIVRSASTRPQAAPDLAKARTVLAQAMQNLYAKPDARLVPAEDIADPARVARVAADRLCYTGGRIYETIVALPRADASLALRYMLSGG